MSGRITLFKLFKRSVLRLLLSVMVAFLAYGGYAGFAAGGVDVAVASCPTNFLYFTDTETGSVGGVAVEGKALHRGLWLYDAWSCIHGQVSSIAGSTIDVVSWEGWKYEDGEEVDNWGSSCINCSSGSSLGPHATWWLQGAGLGVAITVDGAHYFKNGASTLWLYTHMYNNYS